MTPSHRPVTRRLGTTLAALMLSVALVTPNPVHAEEHDDDGNELELIESYLEVADRVVRMAAKREVTIFFAIEGIAETYQAQGDLDAALARFEAMLKEHEGDQTVRNLILFKMRDIYEERGQPKKTLAVLDRVIAENK
ncbi:MAG: hypothetical protein AAF458_23255 [Pseudomonadota bacterium]